MRSGSDVSVDVVIGAIAGISATVAMTLAADRLFRHLPPSDRYPLPPRELTERVALRAGIRDQMNEPQLRAATLISHFGFGAAVGALHGLALPGRQPIGRCVVYGLAVWAASYLGWIPAARLLRPATDHPAQRNALMIAVHVVWGATLGLVTNGLRGSMAPLKARPQGRV